MREIEKPEGVTDEQFRGVLAFLETQPKIKVEQIGTWEARPLWSKEELEARRRSRRGGVRNAGAEK